eukprot:PhF_6_TR6971/c0_g3_i1/m.10299
MGHSFEQLGSFPTCGDVVYIRSNTSAKAAYSTTQATVAGVEGSTILVRFVGSPRLPERVSWARVYPTSDCRATEDDDADDDDEGFGSHDDESDRGAPAAATPVRGSGSVTSPGITSSAKRPFDTLNAGGSHTPNFPNTPRFSPEENVKTTTSNTQSTEGQHNAGDGDGGRTQSSCTTVIDFADGKNFQSSTSRKNLKEPSLKTPTTTTALEDLHSQPHKEPPVKKVVSKRARANMYVPMYLDVVDVTAPGSSRTWRACVIQNLGEGMVRVRYDADNTEADVPLHSISPVAAGSIEPTPKKVDTTTPTYKNTIIAGKFYFCKAHDNADCAGEDAGVSFVVRLCRVLSVDVRSQICRIQPVRISSLSTTLDGKSSLMNVVELDPMNIQEVSSRLIDVVTTPTVLTPRDMVRAYVEEGVTF